MADVATTPSLEAEKKGLTKPEKPDEDVYKTALKNAEKEHADAMAKFVSPMSQKLFERSHALPGIGQSYISTKTKLTVCRTLFAQSLTSQSLPRKTPHLQSVAANSLLN